MPKIDNCNLCGSKNYKTVLVENGLDIVKCSNCGFIYTQYPPEKTFERSELPEDIFLQTENKRTVFNQVLNQIKNGKILDVGCRTGNFLLFAESKGLEPIGVEISPKFASFCKNKGLNVYNSNVLESRFPNQSFDVISYLEVLEHIPKPFEECKEAFRILKNGGLVIIEIPNVTFQLFKAKIFRIMGLNYCGLMPEDHLVHFSEKTIRLLLEKNFFIVEKIMCRSIYLQKKEQIHFKTFLVAFNYISRIIKRIFKINICNAMIVIAKKDDKRMK